MRCLMAFLAVSGLAAPAVHADEVLSLWLKNPDRSQEETICEITRASDGSMAVRVQRVMNSYPARPEPIADPTEMTVAFDDVLARIKDGTIAMDEMNSDMPWTGTDGMELWLVVDGSKRLAREAGLDVRPEVLALFDPLGQGACTRLAKR